MIGIHNNFSTPEVGATVYILCRHHSTLNLRLLLHHHIFSQYSNPKPLLPFPCGTIMPSPAPYVEHQKAVTIQNDVNLTKETSIVVPDEDNPGMFFVAFTFSATLPGRITIMFFGKEGEGEDCDLTPTKETLLPPITVNFQQGFGQKCRQPSGSGINFSMFDEIELIKEGEMDVFPLVIKAESDTNAANGDPMDRKINSQTTKAVFEKEKGKFQVKVVNQILLVDCKIFELQEMYGIGNSIDDGDSDENDLGKECVIRLSGPRDTTILPGRHMCMCSDCAEALSFHKNSCPVCRQPVERLLEIKDENSTEINKEIPSGRQRRRQNLVLEIPSRTIENSSEDFVRINISQTPSPPPKRVNFNPTLSPSYDKFDGPPKHSIKRKSSVRNLLLKLSCKPLNSTLEIEKASNFKDIFSFKAFQPHYKQDIIFTCFTYCTLQYRVVARKRNA